MSLKVDQVILYNIQDYLDVFNFGVKNNLFH